MYSSDGKIKHVYQICIDPVLLVGDRRGTEEQGRGFGETAGIYILWSPRFVLQRMCSQDSDRREPIDWVYPG